MNYLVFKDKYSNHIEGLLISELPPITKPKMRTSITKIDGKDGDIVEELGYESYDKTVKIGLRKGFDIDKISEFFNGKGNLILSNEPDKVYEAQIIDQINYERLVRFRTASIKFHVQPYKYLLNEPDFIFNIDNNDKQEIKVANLGNLPSKPIIKLYGQGKIYVSINGFDAFNIEIDDEYVIVDATDEEAYKERTLKNRFMTGEFPTLNVGINTISWIGKVDKIIVSAKSRWI